MIYLLLLIYLYIFRVAWRHSESRPVFGRRHQLNALNINQLQLSLICILINHYIVFPIVSSTMNAQ